MLINNSTKVKCEGCRKTLAFSGELANLGDELQNAGWGWLRGDEAYDHYCSLKCRTKMLNKESKKDNMAKKKPKTFTLRQLLTAYCLGRKQGAYAFRSNLKSIIDTGYDVSSETNFNNGLCDLENKLGQEDSFFREAKDELKKMEQEDN